MTRGRLAAFDGLRGLLALFVVLSHIAAVVYNPFVPGPPPDALTYALWHLGAPSVDAFFVLSGWVVALSCVRYAHVGRFYAARLRRLYPLALIAALLGLGLARPLAEHLSGSAYNAGFLVYLRAPLTPNDVIGVFSLGLLAPYDANHFNPPLWTLAVEVWASVLMPLFIRAARSWGWVSWPASMVLGLLASVIWENAVFMPLFMLGVLLALRPIKLSARLHQPLLLAGAALLFSRHLSGSNDPLYRWLTEMGAGALLVGLSAAPEPLLRRPWLQWLGARSYALYATHFPVLVLFVFLFGGALGPQWAAAAAVPFALLCADLAQRLADRLTPVRPLFSQGVHHV